MLLNTLLFEETSQLMFQISLTQYFQNINMRCQSHMHSEITRCDMFPSAVSQLTDVVCGILLKGTEQ